MGIQCGSLFRRFGLVSAIVLLLEFGISSGANAALIAISPSSRTVQTGTLLQFDLTISGVNNSDTPALGAFDINLNFDPSLLNFQSAVFETNLDVFGLGDIQSVSTPESGTVNVYEISLDTTADLTANQAHTFTLATFYFNALSVGTSALDVSINALSDANGTALAADVNSGSATITSTVPLPQSWILLLSGLLAAAAHMSRQRSSLR